MLNDKKTAELLPLMEAAFAAGGYFRLWPRGRSMLPLLREGVDSVLLAPPHDVQLHDIVLARLPNGSFLLHRVAALDGGGVLLVGDAHIDTDTEGPLPLDCVLARAVRIYRGDRELDPRSPRLLRYARRRTRRRRFLSVLRAAKRKILK